VNVPRSKLAVEPLPRSTSTVLAAFATKETEIASSPFVPVMVKVLFATDADAGADDAAWAVPPTPTRPSAMVAAAASPKFLPRLLWMLMSVLLVIASTDVRSWALLRRAPAQRFLPERRTGE